MELDWRVDVTGTRDLLLTIEYQGHLWTALYPGSAETRTRFEQLGGDVTLEHLYRMLGRYAGETMTRVSDVQLRRPAGLTP